MKLNLDFLLEILWEYLALIRVYTKKPGQPPDFDDGLILRKGVTVEHVCHAIHRTLAEQFKYAFVWVSRQKIFVIADEEFVARYIYRIRIAAVQQFR